MHSYDALFYDYIERGSVSSAQVIVPMLVRALGPKSVLDVGCGRGAWLSVWHQNGVTDVQGIDGDYVDRHRLLIPPSQFRAANLTQPFSLGRQFDVVQCVEVAEHLPASAAVGFVASLVAHGELVLFSAACPGQGGEHHVNEQPYSYWRDLFRRHDYLMFDWVRPEVLERTDVESWYRYNTFLFAHARKVAKLPAKIRDRQINDQAVIPDLSPFLYRLRKAILRLLPVPWVTLLAVAKHKSDIRKAARAVRTAPPSR